jgi:hypothetical protein
MELKIKLLDSSSDITNKILKALLPEIKQLFKKIGPFVKENIKDLVVNAIKSSPEYLSLMSGILRSELGVPDAEVRINKIFNIWFNNIITEIESPSIAGRSIKGKISISLIKSDLSDILSSDIAVIIDSFSGSSVNWLEWLSIAGDKTILKNYEVSLGPNKRSRTGNAIMKVAVNKKWKVPSEFSGTQNNNWITRSINNVSDEIESILIKSIKQVL